MTRRTLSLPVPPGFSFENTVISHGWYRLAPFRWNSATRTLERTERFSDCGAIDLRIVHEHDLVVEATRAIAPVQDELTMRLQRMFQLHLDLEEFHRLCEGSPAHARVAAMRFGRLLCGSTVFEDVVKIILTTNTRWAQTVRMNDLLVEHYGEPAASGHRAFPTPERLARATSEELAERCRMGYRSRMVQQLAVGVARGDLTLEPPVEVVREGGEALLRFYRQLPGIGPYGAAHLMAMEGKHDFIAVDTEFRAWVSGRYHAGRTVKDSTMVRRYRRWGRWQYLAYWSERWLAH